MDIEELRKWLQENPENAALAKKMLEAEDQKLADQKKQSGVLTQTLDNLWGNEAWQPAIQSWASSKGLVIQPSKQETQTTVTTDTEPADTSKAEPAETLQQRLDEKISGTKKEPHKEEAKSKFEKLLEEKRKRTSDTGKPEENTSQEKQITLTEADLEKLLAKMKAPEVHETTTSSQPEEQEQQQTTPSAKPEAIQSIEKPTEKPDETTLSAQDELELQQLKEVMQSGVPQKFIGTNGANGNHEIAERLAQAFQKRGVPEANVELLKAVANTKDLKPEEVDALAERITKEHPIISKVNQYPNVSASATPPKNKDYSDMTMEQRNQIFAEELEKASK